MDTRLVLPVTAAAALHAFLFWGFGPGEKPPVKQPLKSATQFVETILQPPDPPEETPDLAPVKGSPDADRPTLPEPPAAVRSPFEIPTIPDYPRPSTQVTRISFEPPGDPAGITEGIPNAKIFESINLDNKPRTRSQTPPAYPIEARNSGLTGEVWVEFVVDPSGHVRTARVVRSSNSVFDSATLRAVQMWRFEPGTKNRRPVSFRMVAPVVFNLNDS